VHCTINVKNLVQRTKGDFSSIPENYQGFLNLLATCAT
jgi:hypothetical protein